MFRSVLAAAAIAALASTAGAQTANVSPTSPSGSSPGNAMRTAPSGSTAKPDPGAPQIGTPTPVEERYEHRAQKDTSTVCKGC